MVKRLCGVYGTRCLGPPTGVAASLEHAPGLERTDFQKEWLSSVPLEPSRCDTKGQIFVYARLTMPDAV